MSARTLTVSHKATSVVPDYDEATYRAILDALALHGDDHEAAAQHVAQVARVQTYVARAWLNAYLRYDAHVVKVAGVCWWVRKPAAA